MPVETTSRPTTVRRRTLVRGAAWTVPVVAVAAPAPAFAASCTTLYAGSLDWASNYTRASDTSGSGTMTFDNGRTSAVTVGSVFTNYTANGTTTNTISNLGTTTPVGGTGAAGLVLFQTPNGAGTAANPYRTANRANNQLITISFNPAVYRLSFLITDIDSATGDFLDAIEVAGGTYGSSTATGDVGGTSTVTGTGAQGTPFTQSGANSPYDNNNSPGGNVRVTFTQAVSSITLRYWNNIAPGDITQNPDHAAFIGRMTAAIYNAGCP